jgi:enoyl-CoA hydratase
MVTVATGDEVRVGRDGGVAVITIDRPRAKNAVDRATIERLSALVDDLAADADLRAVVLTGGGGTFIAGGDLKDFLDLEDGAAGKRMSLRMQSVLARFEALEVPVIAAIEGLALGGGAEIAVACDLRIAGADARIGFKQVTLGIMVGWGGGQRLLRLVGRSRALRLLLTGVTLEAREALALGLVDDVVPAGEALAAAVRLAQVIAGQPPAAVRATKRALHHGSEMPRAEAGRFEAECFATVWGSADHRDALDALLRRKRPAGGAPR